MITNDSSCHINWKQFECVQLCSWAIAQEQDSLDGPRRPFSTSSLRASTHPSRRYIEDSLCSLFWAAPWLTRHSEVLSNGLRSGDREGRDMWFILLKLVTACLKASVLKMFLRTFSSLLSTVCLLQLRARERHTIPPWCVGARYPVRTQSILFC